jgi:hypothetical protein
MLWKFRSEYNRKTSSTNIFSFALRHHSSYAKYYFALRSLVEKKDFRQRYNRMVGGVGNVAQADALKVQERTERVKEEALLQLSRSM